MEREEAALISSWEQWERGALQTRASLETTLLQITNSEQEFNRRSTQLEQDLQALSQQLEDSNVRLSQAENKNNGEETVKGWQIAKVGHIFHILQLSLSIFIDISNESRIGLILLYMMVMGECKYISRLFFFV